MKLTSILILLATFAVASVVHAVAGEKESLDENLEPLRPLLGKTWKGEMKGSTAGKPVVDIQRWERALNGKAVRILHSINQGAYGGESLVLWDASKKSVVYYYFTTAGFMTSGTMTLKDGKLLTHENVNGDAGGITEARATTEIGKDGSYHVVSDYLKDGKWVPGRDVTYKEDSSEKIIFQ